MRLSFSFLFPLSIFFDLVIGGFVVGCLVCLDNVDGDLTVVAAVGCPVNGVPMQDFPFDDIFMPLGQWHVNVLGATARRHRWLHPPLLAPQTFALALVTE